MCSRVFGAAQGSGKSGFLVRIVQITEVCILSPGYTVQGIAVF